MKTNLSSSSPSQLETDCLVVVALDTRENDSRENDSRENDRGENESSDKARNEKARTNKDRASKDRNEKDKPAPSIQHRARASSSFAIP